MTESEKMAERLHLIADASRREDGTDIPLGEIVRNAAAMIRRLAAEHARLETHVSELQEKVQADTSCACSYDNPGEVCLPHSPLLAAANSELTRLRAREAKLVKALGNPRDWETMRGELQTWASSAFLAGETSAADGDLKADLYVCLCRLLGYMRTGEDAARAVSPALKQQKSPPSD